MRDFEGRQWWRIKEVAVRRNSQINRDVRGIEKSQKEYKTSYEKLMHPYCCCLSLQNSKFQRDLLVLVCVCVDRTPVFFGPRFRGTLALSTCVVYLDVIIIKNAFPVTSYAPKLLLYKGS